MPQTTAQLSAEAGETQTEDSWATARQRPRLFSALVTEMTAAAASLVVFWLTGRRRQRALGRGVSPGWLWQLSRALRALLVYEGVRVGLGRGQTLLGWLNVQRRRAQQLADAVTDLSDVTRDTARDLRTFVSAESADVVVLRRLERVLALLCTAPARELLGDLVRVAVRESRRPDTECAGTERRALARAIKLQQRPSLAALFREHSVQGKRVSASGLSPTGGAQCESAYASQPQTNGHWSTEWIRLLIASGEPGQQLVQAVVSTAVQEATRTLYFEGQPKGQQRQAGGGHADGARFRILSVLFNFAATEAGRRLISESVAAAVSSAMPILLEDGQARQSHGNFEQEGHLSVSSGEAPGGSALDSSVSTAASEQHQTPSTPVHSAKESEDRSPAMDRWSRGTEPMRRPRAPMSPASPTTLCGPSAPPSPFLERVVRLALREKEVLKEVASAAASEAVRSYLLTVNEMHVRQQQRQQEHPSPLVKPMQDHGLLGHDATAAVSAQTSGKSAPRHSGRAVDSLPSTADYKMPPLGVLPHSFSVVPLHPMDKLIRTMIKRLLLGTCTALQRSTEVLRPPLDEPQWLFW